MNEYLSLKIFSCYIKNQNTKLKFFRKQWKKVNFCQISKETTRKKNIQLKKKKKIELKVLNHDLYFTIKFINTLSASASDSDASKITFDSNRLKNKYFLSNCLTYQINYSNGHSIKVNPEQELHLLNTF